MTVPRLIAMATILVANAALFAGTAAAIDSPSIFAPAAEPAQSIRSYSLLVIGICGAIFLVVGSILAVVVVRFRARPGDDDREPAQIYGSAQIELAWTVIPILIVVVMSLVTARNILDLQKVEAPPGFMPVVAIGHQWWWEFQYPEYGFTTANELHIPVDRGSYIDLESVDVVHSFWVPQLSGKIDVIPNRTNHLWIRPSKPGLFVGQCAEYCGTQHAKMLLRVYVHEPDEFRTWAENQTREAILSPAVAKGRHAFERTACINCHAVRGTIADGRFGPDLTHLMSRATIGSGAAPNDRAHLTDWIIDPDHLKPGAHMPAMKLEPKEVELMVSFLATLE